MNIKKHKITIKPFSKGDEHILYTFNKETNTLKLDLMKLFFNINDIDTLTTLSKDNFSVFVTASFLCAITNSSNDELQISHFIKDLLEDTSSIDLSKLNFEVISYHRTFTNNFNKYISDNLQKTK